MVLHWFCVTDFDGVILFFLIFQTVWDLFNSDGCKNFVKRCFGLFRILFLKKNQKKRFRRYHILRRTLRKDLLCVSQLTFVFETQTNSFFHHCHCTEKHWHSIHRLGRNARFCSALSCKASVLRTITLLFHEDIVAQVCVHFVPCILFSQKKVFLSQSFAFGKCCKPALETCAHISLICKTALKLAK